MSFSGPSSDRPKLLSSVLAFAVLSGLYDLAAALSLFFLGPATLAAYLTAENVVPALFALFLGPLRITLAALAWNRRPMAFWLLVTYCGLVIVLLALRPFLTPAPFDAHVLSTAYFCYLFATALLFVALLSQRSFYRPAA